MVVNDVNHIELCFSSIIAVDCAEITYEVCTVPVYNSISPNAMQDASGDETCEADSQA